MSARYPWSEIREKFEAGELTRDLAAEYGCTMRAIQIRARSGNWKRPAGWSPPRSRTVASDGRIGDHERRIADVSDVARVHREDWERLRPLISRALETARKAKTEAALLEARTGKLLCDSLRTIQAGERQAWGVDAATLPDLDSISDAELERTIAEASERIAEARRKCDGDSGGATIH